MIVPTMEMNDFRDRARMRIGRDATAATTMNDDERRLPAVHGREITVSILVSHKRPFLVIVRMHIARQLHLVCGRAADTRRGAQQRKVR